ncbi:hypothetical protein VUR80DRAFT_10355 [Thermomyces stellatus]
MDSNPATPAANPPPPSTAPAPSGPLPTSTTTTTTGTSSSSSSSSKPTVRTRILIISDTHGVTPTTEPPAEGGGGDAQCSSHGHTAPRSAFHNPLPEADVVIHCGDLTKRSTLGEYRATVSLLHAVRAPVKIAIAGNHDISLHESYYSERAASFAPSERPDFGWLVRQLASNHDASALLSSSDGITYLEEGARCRAVDVTPEGDTPVEKGKQTMFVNAAILDRRYRIGQFPWLVEIDLPRA